MTLQQAIEILQKDIDDPGSVDIMDVNQAEKLLIEAGQRIEEYRGVVCTPVGSLLPGETRE